MYYLYIEINAKRTFTHVWWLSCLCITASMQTLLSKLLKQNETPFDYLSRSTDGPKNKREPYKNFNLKQCKFVWVLGHRITIPRNEVSEENLIDRTLELLGEIDLFDYIDMRWVVQATEGFSAKHQTPISKINIYNFQ